MGNKILLLLFYCLFISASIAQEIKYTIDASRPETNTYSVDLEMKFDVTRDSIILKMATWTPGSYLIREFSKHVNRYGAFDQKNNSLKSKKLNKNTWIIYPGKSKLIHFKYEVYAHELSVRTTFLDSDLGLINGASLFIYPENSLTQSSEISILKPNEWKISTTLQSKNEKSDIFISSNFDELFDSPILLGTHDEFTFEAAGVTHRVAVTLPTFYDEERIKKDLKKITESQTSIFNENPNSEYLFLVITRKGGGGGLEHMNSTTLVIDRFSMAGESGYQRFLSLAAHEYFHLWNVKRIRPIELGPFNYETENFTDLLWMMEGFTSYFGAKTLYRCGFSTKEAFLSRLINSIESESQRPGNKVQSLAESSLDAWIKFYRDDENDYNSTSSYYSHGLLLGYILDLKIINDTKGEKSLDDLMKTMYLNYYKNKNRGFTTNELLTEINALTSVDYTEFFNRYIYGTEELPYQDILENFGFEVSKDASTTEWGFQFRNINNRDIVVRVIDESVVRKAGLNVGDEIIAIEDFAFTRQKLEFFSNYYPSDHQIRMLIQRDDLIKTLIISIPENKSDNLSVKLKNDLSENEQFMLDKFLSIK